MENSSKAIPIIAIAALVCGVVGLILGFVALKKSSQVDVVTEIKDANSTISQSVASLQDEVSGLSKKYVTMTQLKDFANSTQEGFNQITDSLTKVRTQSRADTIKIAEIESRLQGGASAKPSTSTSTSPSASSTTSSSSSSSSATPAALPATVSNVPPGGTQYTIQSGDTLGKVASNFGITLDKLMEANPGVQPRYLRVGQTITIPE
jgi:LysM repeat protein